MCGLSYVDEQIGYDGLSLKCGKFRPGDVTVQVAS